MNSIPSDRLRVWAPNKTKVQLVGDVTEDLRPEDENPGWWTLGRPLPPGTRYGFVLDGKGPMPDPRSPSQPDGVHGLSETVHHQAFAWTDSEWLPPLWEHAVVYELHVGTFSPEGTFVGAIAKLPHLAMLGVTHVEIMPVAEFPGDRGWGYDGASLYAPHHAYGGPTGLKRLVNACHLLGLAVVLDVVYNHLGPDGNYLPEYGPYFSDRHTTPWGPGLNVDSDNCGPVREFLIQNALMWLRDYHFDGLRLDAIDKVTDDSAKHLLVQLREEVDQLASATGRPRVLIAESAANDSRYVTPTKEGGLGMDSQWNDDLHHALRTLFTKESESYYVDFGRPDQLAKALRQGFVYDGVHSEFQGKPHGKPPGAIPKHALLAYLQTHDQVGNRALGDRFHHHGNSGMLQQQIASAMVLLGPFVPMIFMGEEWAASSPFQYFTDHNPELGKAVSEGRVKEFGAHWDGNSVPDPQAVETFENSKLSWDDHHVLEHREMLQWYTRLLGLRRKHPDLGTDGPVAEVEIDHEGRWITMRRGAFLVIASLAKGPVTITAPHASTGGLVASAGASYSLTRDDVLEFEGMGILIMGS